MAEIIEIRKSVCMIQQVTLFRKVGGKERRASEDSRGFGLSYWERP